MRRRMQTACFAALLAVSCVGAGSEPEARKKPAIAQVTDEKVAPVPLRRLTREEYNNSVRDLLGDNSRPALAFPPDETVAGFESNNIAPVTELLVQRYMDAAEELAARAMSRIDTLAPCNKDAQPEARASDFIERFGRLVYRRPLEAKEQQALLSVYRDKAAQAGYTAGIQLTLEVMLQSPQFLYRLEPQDGAGASARALTGYELATRLSYFVWASTPDRQLLDEAAAGRLSEPADVERAMRRLLADARAKDGVRSFHRQWLGLRELETESKDNQLSPSFTPELKAAMIEETLRFAAHTVFEDGDTVSKLFRSKQSFINAPLAALYGVEAPREGFALVELPADQRSGVLTHASVLSVHANANQTSPILRGKFVREKFLCQEIPPPPANVNITPPKVDPKLTTKQRFEQHRTDRSCSGCHQMMDPIGFGFEHYDAIGAYRTVDGAFPVDAVGELTVTKDANGAFNGAVELGAKLAASEQVRRCVATQWFRFALGRGEVDDDADSLSAAYETFARKGFDVRELMVAIAKSHAFRHARFEEGPSP